MTTATPPAAARTPALTPTPTPTPGPSPTPAPAPTADLPAATVWPQWQRVLFRFAFVYALLRTAPWGWLDAIPFVARVTRYLDMLDGWAVEAANARFFHVRDPLVPVNGSGDTSFAWAQLALYLALAAVAALVWTAVDRRRRAYPRLLYWTRTFVRYWVAAAALSYGIIKLFLLQMSFPTLSQLATPLGDFLPMRFSWMFIGYSAPYQFFSGLVETVAGLLLFRRNTVTLGLMVAAGAFLNVVLINLSYDVPVKLYASHLLLGCLVLLTLDGRRLFTFLVLNRAAPGTTAYEPHYRAPWHRYAAMAAKGVLVVLFFVMPVTRAWGRYQSPDARATPGALPSRPFRAGVYDVRRFVRNGDTVAVSAADSLRWKDVIFDNPAQGSVGTADTAFWQRYRRGYFRYQADTLRHTLAAWRTSTRPGDSVPVFTGRYELPDSVTVRLWARLRGDSVYAELVRTNRRFQLAERQFHWLSEYNR
jgi:hypothetical protein